MWLFGCCCSDEVVNDELMPTFVRKALQPGWCVNSVFTSSKDKALEEDVLPHKSLGHPSLQESYREAEEEEEVHGSYVVGPSTAYHEPAPQGAEEEPQEEEAQEEGEGMYDTDSEDFMRVYVLAEGHASLSPGAREEAPSGEEQAAREAEAQAAARAAAVALKAAASAAPAAAAGAAAPAAAAGAAAPKQQGRTDDAADSAATAPQGLPLPFKVVLQKDGVRKIGLDVRHYSRTALEVLSVKDGLVSDHNARVAKMVKELGQDKVQEGMVQAGDVILAVNDNRGTANMLLGVIAAEKRVELLLQRGLPPRPRERVRPAAGAPAGAAKPEVAQLRLPPASANSSLEAARAAVAARKAALEGAASTPAQDAARTAAPAAPTAVPPLNGGRP